MRGCPSVRPSRRKCRSWDVPRDLYGAPGDQSFFGPDSFIRRLHSASVRALAGSTLFEQLKSAGTIVGVITPEQHDVQSR